MFIKGDALRRLEPTANVNNTAGYKRINNNPDESDMENTSNNKRINSTNQDDSEHRSNKQETSIV